MISVQLIFLTFLNFLYYLGKLIAKLENPPSPVEKLLDYLHDTPIWSHIKEDDYDDIQT